MKTQYVFLVFTALLLNMQFVSAQLLPAQPRPQTKVENNVFTADFLTVTPISPTGLVQELLGPAAVISNLSYTGALTAIAKFNFTNTTTGLDSGVILTTGKPEFAIGPNTSTSQGFSCNTPGDSILTALANQQTFDAASIEFDLAVTTDTLAFQFVFGSEEYPEYVNSTNDAFGFFITGSDPFTLQNFIQQNIAIVPGTLNTPISIGTINNVMPSFPQFYVDNTGGQELQYDGYTTPLTILWPVINGAMYHLKIAIADGGDHAYDSGIFLKGKCLSGYATMPVATFTSSTSGLTTTFNNSATYAKYFVWDFGDGTTDTTLFGETCAHTYDSSGIYNVLMKAVNYYQVDSILQTITVGNVGLAEYDYTTAVTKLSDGIFRLDLPFTPDTKAEIYTLDGRVVKSLKGNSDSVITLDIRDLPEGVYFVQVTSGKQYYNARLIR
jgi:PKD repeat protein